MRKRRNVSIYSPEEEKYSYSVRYLRRCKYIRHLLLSLSALLLLPNNVCIMEKYIIHREASRAMRAIIHLLCTAALN